MATSLGKVGIKNRGRFDASATYAAGEYVYYMGSTFIALQNLPAGMVPQHDGINWNFLAEGASVEQVLQNFAPIEDGATVSQAYSAGSYLLHEDILYKTLTDIASGGAIIIGTNITPVTIGEEMHSLAKNFANEEDSAVATMNYNVGQYLVYNEHFYKVTTAISAGQALVPGTNIEATNVGAQLSVLSDSFHGLDWYTLLSGTRASTTKTETAIMTGRSISDYNLILILFSDSNDSYVRSSMIVSTDVFTQKPASPSYVNSASQQFWLEVTYASESSVYLQTSSNAQGSTVRMYGIKLNKALS